MDKKKSLCQAQPRRDTRWSRDRTARQSRATRAVAWVTRLVIQDSITQQIWTIEMSSYKKKSPKKEAKIESKQQYFLQE